MSSSRLPGKVMAPLAGAPMIQRQIERLRRCALIDELVVATSVDPTDDALAAFLEEAAVNVFRGPLDDVLARFVGAHEAFGPASHIVRLTADCPFVDPEIIDDVIDMTLDAQADYASNTPPERTFPKGLDVEVFTAESLAMAAANPSPQAREHVTWDMFRETGLCPQQAFLSQEDDEGEVRWTVDRPDDYDFTAAVYDALYDPRRPFTSDDIRAFVRDNPQWAAFGGDRRI